MRRLLLIVVCAACGIRAPARVDVGALLAAQGPIEARRTLEMRVLADARDVQAELALAALDERIGRPSEAIDAIETVLRLGGPLGARWHSDDRARFAALIAARGRARLARGAATARADLLRARKLGAALDDDELLQAKNAAAIVALRHVDPDTRAQARRDLQVPLVSPGERGMFGLHAWEWGARREAYDQLTAWHALTRPPRDPALQAAYVRALAWWQPADAEPPPRDELVGDDRCWFVDADCLPTTPDVVAPTPVSNVDAEAPPLAAAAARYAAARAANGQSAGLLAVAEAYIREPLVADRLSRDIVAQAVDGAAAHATLGALFDALGDPARARAHWFAAADASDEAAFVRGLAEACARGDDPAAALVYVQRAAAAGGDPAPVLIAVARDLESAGAHEGALVAAHAAIDLAGVATLPAALDIAIAASRGLGRDGQAEAFARDRARLAVRVPDSADRLEALAAIRALPNGVTLARAWVVSRSRPHDAELHAALYAALPADDPRRGQLAMELVVLAGDVDDASALEAVRALRP